MALNSTPWTSLDPKPTQALVRVGNGIRAPTVKVTERREGCDAERAPRFQIEMFTGLELVVAAAVVTL